MYEEPIYILQLGDKLMSKGTILSEECFRHLIKCVQLYIKIILKEKAQQNVLRKVF